MLAGVKRLPSVWVVSSTIMTTAPRVTAPLRVAKLWSWQELACAAPLLLKKHYKTHNKHFNKENGDTLLVFMASDPLKESLHCASTNKPAINVLCFVVGQFLVILSCLVVPSYDSLGLSEKEFRRKVSIDSCMFIIFWRKFTHLYGGIHSFQMNWANLASWQ